LKPIEGRSFAQRRPFHVHGSEKYEITGVEGWVMELEHDVQVLTLNTPMRTMCHITGPAMAQDHPWAACSAPPTQINGEVLEAIPRGPYQSKCSSCTITFVASIPYHDGPLLSHILGNVDRIYVDQHRHCEHWMQLGFEGMNSIQCEYARNDREAVVD
jgi:hypothetical protein